MGSSAPEFGAPNFSDAVGPAGWGGPQGSMAGVNYVDEYSYGVAVRPAARMDMNSTAEAQRASQGLRGYHTGGIGGSASPNALAKKSSAGVERSGAS
jgi:hypothetical protein